MALNSAHRISGPVRPPSPYTFTPFEVGADAEDVTFSARDGVRLAGWWLDRPDSRDVVIVSHGHRGNKSDLLGIGPGLWREGFTVFMFDFRGNGDSADGPQSLAHYEQADLEAAIDLAASRRPDARISLVGFSMGAAVSIIVAARDQRVSAVVADSAFAQMRDIIVGAARSMRLPPVPAVDMVDVITGWRYGYRFKEVRPVDVIGEIAPRPLLLVHGEADTLIPVENAYRLRDATGGHAELHVTPGAGHCGSYFTDRPGYIAAVAAFLAR